MENYNNYLGLGIAGNFALHLAQAGELEDFKNIITEDEAAPKGMFPFYLPSHVATAKNILNTYPLSSSIIKLPNTTTNVQAEPEVSLICELEYNNNTLSSIKPLYFSAYNDCSIRVAGANKISDKKNWGINTKGLSEKLIAIDKFSPDGIMDNFSIVSYLKRGDELHQYGEDVKLSGYSYFYEKLLQWMIQQINTQKDFGPLEAINDYIAECAFPTKAVISIGATRYTEYGEKTFLKDGDEVFIIVYNHTIVSSKEILENITHNSFDTSKMSVLHQRVVL